MGWKIFKRTVLAILCVIIAGSALLFFFGGVNFGRSMYDTAFIETDESSLKTFYLKHDIEVRAFNETDDMKMSVTGNGTNIVKEEGKVVSETKTKIDANVIKLKVNDKLQYLETSSIVDGDIIQERNSYYLDGKLYTYTKDGNSELVVDNKSVQTVDETEVVVAEMGNGAIFKEINDARLYGVKISVGYNASYTLYKLNYQIGEENDYVKVESTYVYGRNGKLLGVKTVSNEVYVDEYMEYDFSMVMVLERYSGEIEFPQDLNTYSAQ